MSGPVWLEDFLYNISRWYRPAYVSPLTPPTIINSSTYICPIIHRYFPNAIDAGKVKIGTDQYKMFTKEDYARWLLSKKFHELDYSDFRQCGHYAWLAASSFSEKDCWTGAAVGPIIYMMPGTTIYHARIMCVWNGDLHFWEPMDGIWTPPHTVLETPMLDQIWLP